MNQTAAKQIFRFLDSIKLRVGGIKAAVRKADNLSTFICRLSLNLGPSTFWNPQGLSRPVQGLFYLTDLNVVINICAVKSGQCG
jgi:hypothetical protein